MAKNKKRSIFDCLKMQFLLGSIVYKDELPTKNFKLYIKLYKLRPLNSGKRKIFIHQSQFSFKTRKQQKLIETMRTMGLFYQFVFRQTSRNQFFCWFWMPKQWQKFLELKQILPVYHTDSIIIFCLRITFNKLNRIALTLWILKVL